MCTHKNIHPIVETNEKGDKMVYATVCTDCFKEFPISPMTLLEYSKIKK